MKKIKVAITGNIGSGKSSFSEYLLKRGCAVIISDDISKTLLGENESIKQKVIAGFGKEVYKGDILNAQYLANKVFSKPEKLKKLNSILHPIVLSEIESIIAKEYPAHKIIFIETALVYEADIEKQFDYVVLITADDNLRLKRILASKKVVSENDFKNREMNQIPESEKEKRADFIFRNDGSKQDLFKKADLLLLTLGLEKSISNIN